MKVKSVCEDRLFVHLRVNVKLVGKIMIVVTGGAGCIGIAVVWSLNKRGITDIILVGRVDHPEKVKNIASLDYYALENKDIFLDYIINSNIP